MHLRIACLKQTASVALGVTIGVVCMMGTGGPVRAEPISGLIVEQTPGHSVTPGKWPEAAGSPLLHSSDVEDAKDSATVAKPGQEQLGTDRQPLLPPDNRSRLTTSRSQTKEPTGSPDRTTYTNEDWTLNREIKEAVRPLYEDLKAYGVAETVRGLKSDIGLNDSSSFNDPTTPVNVKDSGNSAPREFASAEGLGNSAAPQNRPQSATEIEQNKLAAAAAFREFVEELKPWLFALAGLYVLGYMIKLGLDYFRWSATRSAKRRSRGIRRHRRHRRPQGATDKSHV